MGLYEKSSNPVVTMGLLFLHSCRKYFYRSVQKMRTITNLIKPGFHVYVLFDNHSLCRQFLIQAEWEGFTIGDKQNPTEIDDTNVLAVLHDKKLCHLGFASHMALHSAQKNIIRINYGKYINGEKHYTL